MRTVLFAGGFNYLPASAGEIFRIIQRTDDFFVLVKIRINFPLLPDMVAGGQTVSSGIKQVVGNSRGQPKTVCGVFSVGDDNVNMVFLLYFSQMFNDNVSAGATDNVSAI